MHYRDVDDSLAWVKATKESYQDWLDSIADAQAELRKLSVKIILDNKDLILLRCNDDNRKEREMYFSKLQISLNEESAHLRVQLDEKKKELKALSIEYNLCKNEDSFLYWDNLDSIIYTMNEELISIEKSKKPCMTIQQILLCFGESRKYFDSFDSSLIDMAP